MVSLEIRLLNENVDISNFKTSDFLLKSDENKNLMNLPLFFLNYSCH